MRYRRRRITPQWYCAGCKEYHNQVAVPYWQGPEDEEGRNMYCASSHPDKPLEDKQKILAAMYRHGREKNCSISVVTVGDWLGKALEKDPTLGKWDDAIEGGKSYLVGRDVPTKKFLSTHSSTISTAWMWLAVQLVTLDPTLEIHAHHDRPRLDYVIRRMGEFVLIGLPHQDAGGEKHWITRDLKRKVLVNVD